ncbi:MAG TPA: GNAT family N-acetyltransferase [Armatimonadota bacterium]|nr:GNAT family N-acetyltransferase [Armatimonadota bacterium]
MEGKPQACSSADRESLVQLTNRVFRSRGGDMGSEYPLVFGEAYLDHCRIVKEDGKVVAHVGVTVRDASLFGCALRVGMIGAVCTDPDYRGKGYATLLLQDARALAQSEGASLMLISGGRGLYHRNGFVSVGEFSAFTAAAASLPAPRPGLRIQPCERKEIPALLALNQQRPVRFLRPPDDWDALLAAQMLMNRPADCLGIWEGENLVAYAGTQRSQRDASGSPTPPRIFEYAGSETALFESLGAIAARSGADRVDIAILPGSSELTRLLRAASAEEQHNAFGGTVGIIDPARFFTAFRPYLEERLGSLAARFAITPTANGGACIAYGDDSYQLENMGQLTALVFGGNTEEARAVPQPPETLQPLLARLFPLPLLWYGYNYV